MLYSRRLDQMINSVVKLFLCYSLICIRCLVHGIDQQSPFIQDCFVFANHSVAQLNEIVTDKSGKFGGEIEFAASKRFLFHGRRVDSINASLHTKI